MNTPPYITQNWRQLAQHKVGAQSGGTSGMAGANEDMIRRVIRGMGPDKITVDPACGARVAMNIPAVHVPSFCAPGQSKAYKNSYDLGKTARVGEEPPGTKIHQRVVVDQAISEITRRKAHEIYFGAVEINGSGIRFYGDICFVLKTDKITDDTVVLSSNSYDITRPPMTPVGVELKKGDLATLVGTMAGLWGSHTADMAVLKVFATRQGSQRRFTTGQVSDAVLDDEDYLEVLKVGSFATDALQEARVSAADSAAEGQIGERLRLGMCPDMSELHWRKHRRAAVRALQRQGIRTRVITTSGRVRA